MNKFTLTSVAIIGLALLFSSCENEEEIVVITVDDAAEYVAASMAIATYGALDNMNYVSEQITTLIDCDESESETRTDTKTSSDGKVTANFTIAENYSRTCSGGEEIITYDFSLDQDTESERLNTSHQISGDWIINGAEASSTTLAYGGDYTRAGEWTYNLEDNHTDNVTTSFVFSNVKANKGDGVIFEGTSTFSMNGTSTIYEPFTYEGDITFLSNNTCIATFSTGEQYEINLDTGEVTPI